MEIRTDALEPLPLPEPPVTVRLSPSEWVRRNLLVPWHNAALTVIFGGLLGWVLFRMARFVLVSGRWEIVRRNMTNFMVGFYPREQLWRVWTALFVIAIVFGIRVGATAAGRPAFDAGGGTGRRRAWSRAWPLALLVAVIALLSRSGVTIGLLAAIAAMGAAGYGAGRILPFRYRRWTTAVLVLGLVAGYEIVSGFGGVGFGRWGGLMLTLFLALGGILLSFPLGVLLALGRRSSLPAVRSVCIAYIELIRGVPLVALIFVGAFVVGFFVPPGIRTPDLVTRALIALILFTAAYVAEIVRGGLQAVPRGQVEAAMAVGLSPFTAIRLIVLPQAVRAVIPAIVGQFISLFKDTSLVSIVGLVEWLGVARQVTKQPEFLAQGLEAETFVFAGFLYWVGAYWMSRESRRIEVRMGLGER